MRLLATVLLIASAWAQSTLQFPTSHTTESLRGVSAVSRNIAWASGTHGTYLRTTDAGKTWIPAQVPKATSLDFRGIVAFSADEAFLMSSGPGDQSRIYHTADAGQHWTLQFANADPKGFFDSIAFWDPKHGVVLGDPVPDEHGKLKFELLLTDDGRNWHQVPPSQLPEASAGEGAFAASNTCLAILRSRLTHHAPSSRRNSPNSVILSEAVAQAQREQLRNRRIPILSTSLAPQQGILSSVSYDTIIGDSLLLEVPAFSAASDTQTNRESALDPNIWFATGGKVARVFHSPDRGKTWQVFNTPIAQGPDSAGIFSIAFRDAQHGVIAGGDYKHPQQDGPNLAFTEDGGKTWQLSDIKPQPYFSAAAYAPGANSQHLILVAQDFILDYGPPTGSRRISGKSEQGFAFNAVSVYPEGGVLLVGSKGIIASIP